MENIYCSSQGLKLHKGTENYYMNAENLTQAERNKEYIIKKVDTNDLAMKDFLFTLGCYEGESITLISVLSDNYVISVKDARYSIDKALAEAILI